ncbi:TPA: site-specific DNA-methyltransferase [Streptococcus suis]|nr:site-specific DNA-methyltransferase [Streptococcus suis]
MLRDNKQFNESVKSNSAFLDELRQKMPEFFTASKYDEEGNLVESSTFDNEKFQQALKEHNIDELSSGYRLDFIGKNYAKKQAGERPTTVIVPDNDHNQKAENKNSKNLFFTGDNLEVLRHLQQNYANSVDFIYIDPPYNTGSDGFVYPDKFEYSDDQLKDMFALNDDELKRLKSIQGKATHSAWLTFMYPRLYLAKKVLKDTGVIFVSIDDNEQANLKLLMDEVFGEGSFVQEIAWRRTDNQPNIGQVAKVKEYILVYGKNISSLEYGRLPLSESALKEYRYEDAYAVKFRRGILLHKTRGRHSYPVKTKSGKILTGPWMVTEEKLKEMDDRDEIYWTTGGDEQPYSKIYLKDNKGAIPNDFWGIEYGTNQRASLEVESLLGKRLFDFPKPTTLIKRTLNLGTKPNSIVLDFFAGSSTTADAVMQLNAEDGGNRQYIMCTLPEPTFTVNSDGTEVPTRGGEAAYKAGYRSIDEISRERIIRAANKIKEENPLLTETQDFGFKHYRVVAPTQETLEKIDYDDQLQLDLFDDMIDAFSSEKLGVAGNADGFDTILHTYLAKDNYKFDVPLQMKDFAGIQLPYVNNQRIYLIANNWRAENTRALVNAIGKNELVVQTIVVYGYTLEMESLRELEIALNQLENKVNLQVRY